jgi:hypothetical protein
MPGSSHRRTFLGRLAAGTAAFGAALAGGASPLEAMPPRPMSPRPMSPSEEFKPARHPQDDWMDEIPGKHRLFLDAVTPRGAAEAITFASNYALANKNGYGLAAPELAILICYRHFATPFAFGDDAWAKYGAAWSGVLGFTDPATGAAPVRNVWNARGLTGMQPNRGVTVADAAARGIRFCVCDLAARAFAGMAAQATGGKTDAIYEELKRGTVAGAAQFVAAGIVAVGRAQERGYSFSYVG